MKKKKKKKKQTLKQKTSREESPSNGQQYNYLGWEDVCVFVCVCVCACVCVCVCVCMCVLGGAGRERKREGARRGLQLVLIEQNIILYFDAALLRSSGNCAQRSHNVVAMSRHFRNFRHFLHSVAMLYIRFLYKGTNLTQCLVFFLLYSTIQYKLQLQIYVQSA